MARPIIFPLAAALAFALGATPLIAAEPGLEEGFRQPPDSAKPHTWWHWMNGNITEEGITADLEAMKAAGVGGAQIFNVDCGIPAGPVRFLSPEWRALVRHALAEADRLGIEICLHNCAGWSSSGGPWVKPEHAMQVLTWSEAVVRGGARVKMTLPQPPTKLDHYREIAVLAFPLPEAERGEAAHPAPQIACSESGFDGAKAIDGTPDTGSGFPRPKRGKPASITLDFGAPIPARTLEIAMPTRRSGERVRLSVSPDGKAYRQVAELNLPGMRSPREPITVAFDPVEARAFRLDFLTWLADEKTIQVHELRLSAGMRIDRWTEKAGFVRGADLSPATDATPEGVAISKEAIRDLSGQVGPGGALDWEAPPGEWLVVRYGHTATGKTNHPAPPEGTGPECDKMSREAADAFWAGGVQPVLDDAGPLVGRSLRQVLIDSYEVRSQNWTPKFAEEFRRRRGYDIMPFLPAMTGRIVGSVETTERFLWDLRRTIADLFAENYFGRFAELCHERGLQLAVEPYGNGPFDEVAAGAAGDIPMGEFWVGRPPEGRSVRLAASVANLYGLRFVGAESFTADAGSGRWQTAPAKIKALGDRMWCAGVNRYIFHRYAHQPWNGVAPGMTMGPWGFHFDRTNTWWGESGEWLRYIARSQWMLQNGHRVADVLAYCGEGSPNGAGEPKDLPEGFGWDACDTRTLLSRLKVDGGRLFLPNGASYAALVLPDRDAATPALLRRIAELVRAGATVIGKRPARSPGLSDGPGADPEARALAAEIWDSGKERHAWDRPLPEVLSALAIPPDFAHGSKAELNWIHRRTADADIYFVSSQSQKPEVADCTFRVAGRQPEIWNADTARIAPAPFWQAEGDRTRVTLSFEPAGSLFVVFRRPPEGPAYAGARLPAGAETPAPALAILSARYGDPENMGNSADVADKLRALVADNRVSTRADNALAGRDPAPMVPKRLAVRYSVGGEERALDVDEGDSFELPGAPASALDAPVPLPEFDAEGLPGGGVRLVFWKPCEPALDLPGGKPRTIPAPEIPAETSVAGPWTLSFQPGRGGPGSPIPWPALVSWTEHPDPGVRFFSGTAEYRTKFPAPATAGQPGFRHVLDLGRVLYFARVRLNGKELPVLWKPPYRADVTGLLRPGENELAVSVTNLWPNRLIGDGREPDECEWRPNGAIAKLPAWLTSGEPRPNGRVAFATWKHWKADDRLLESGLLGPVTLRTGSVVEVPAPRP